jgi:hypothetical protein
MERLVDTTPDRDEVVTRLLLPFSLIFTGMQLAGLIWKGLCGLQALSAWLFAA